MLYILTFISNILLFLSAYFMIKIPSAVTATLCFIIMIIFMVCFGRMIVNGCNRLQNKNIKD